MSDADHPRRGMEFEHLHQIVGSPKAGTVRPMVCTVTKVTPTAVYFRNETGYLSYVARNVFPDAVRQVLHS